MLIIGDKRSFMLCFLLFGSTGKVDSQKVCGWHGMEYYVELAIGQKVCGWHGMEYYVELAIGRQTVGIRAVSSGGK